MKKPPVANFSRLAKLENHRPRLEGCCFENLAKKRHVRFRSLGSARLEPVTDSYRVSVVLQSCYGGLGRGAGVGRGLGVGVGAGVAVGVGVGGCAQYLPRGVGRRKFAADDHFTTGPNCRVFESS